LRQSHPQGEAELDWLLQALEVGVVDALCSGDPSLFALDRSPDWIAVSEPRLALASLYESGYDAERDYPEAVRWYRETAGRVSPAA
jgi:TPR repeat protein